jgi:hypothetical protein
MTKHEVVDLTLECAACGDGFVFSAGEQELHRLRGIATVPDHCPACARGRVPAAGRRGKDTSAT